MPSLVDELLRGGGERVRHRVPDVAAAIAVEIDSVLVEFRRQELRKTGGAGPGRAHVLARHLAVAKEFQRQDEFGAVLILAPADIGLRRQHAQPVVGQRVAAVICFAAPDREHDRRRHAEARFDRGKCCAMLLHQPLPLGRQPRDAGFFQIVRRHLHELGLRRRTGGRASGQHQIGQLEIGLEAACLRIERRARDSGRLRLRPQRSNELREAGIGGACRS